MRLTAGGQLLVRPPALPVRPLPAAALSAFRARLAWCAVAAGVLLAVVGLGLSDELARRGGRPPFEVFWAAYALELVVVTVAGVRLARSCRATVVLLVVHGVVTFLPKLLMSLSGPAYFDEPGHWRHAQDVLRLGRLDVATPWLPITEDYPGLAVMTVVVSRTTGLDAWASGQLLVLLAHTGVLLAVLSAAQALGLGRRAAFLAALLFSLNPNYLFFDAQYGYESVALPLAVVAVVLAFRARTAGSAARACGLSAAAAAVGCLVVVTHHVSALVAVGTLVLVALAVPARPGRPAGAAARWAPWTAAVVVAGAGAVWVLAVADETFPYVAPHVGAGVRDALALLGDRGGSAQSRTLFGGSAAPVYEKVAGFLVPPVVGLGVLASLLQLRRTRDLRRARAALPFLALAAVYFLSLPLALTVSGSESAHRAWGPGWVGLAVVLPLGLPVWRAAADRSPRLLRRPAPLVGLLVLVLLAVGCTGAGSSVRYRFPGPAEFGADARATTPDLLALADWMDDNLPAGDRVVSDRFTSTAVIGRTRLSVPTPQESLVHRLYREGGYPTPRLRDFLRDRDFRWFVLDRRILSQQPVQKLFQGYAGPSSVSVPALRTVGTTPFLQRVHEQGPYVVLRVRP